MLLFKRNQVVFNVTRGLNIQNRMYSWSRIIRFIDGENKVRYGQQIEPTNFSEALPIVGGFPSILSTCSQSNLSSGVASSSFQVAKTPVDVVRLLSPLDPKLVPAIFGIGLNYKGHAKETNRSYPTHPMIFSKPSSSIQNPFDAVEIPDWDLEEHVPQIDFEAELAVVIGKQCKDVTSFEEAKSCILGFTIANDVTDRAWQNPVKGGGQFCFAKGFDTFCPIGPVLVHPSALFPKSHDATTHPLAISSKLNGKIMQNSLTSDMVFHVYKLIESLSKGVTLLPGTLILTGTPAGVGVARKPQVFMKHGDRIEVSIEGIGTLKNPIVQLR